MNAMASALADTYTDVTRPDPWFMDHTGECAMRLRDALHDPAQEWMREATAHASMQAMIDLMLGASEPMFLAWGGERRVLYNDAYAVILGERHPAALGMPMAALWTEVWRQMGPLVDSVFAGGSVQMDDLVLQLQRNGALRETHFNFCYHPVRNPQRQVMALFCACRETTGPHNEQRRREQQAALRWRLFSLVPGFVALLRGPRHVVDFVNRSFESAFGSRPVTGHALGELLPGAQAQGFMGLLDHVLQTGQRIERRHAALTLPGPDGKPVVRRFDFVLEPLRNQEAGVGGVFVQGLDVTDLYLAHEVARAGDERHEALLDTMSESLMLLDDRLRVVQLNRAGLAMEGRPRHEIVGRPFAELWGERARPVQALLQAALDSGEAGHLEHHDQSTQPDRWLELDAYPVPHGVALLYRDVSAIKLAEGALRESENRFRAAVAAVGVMWTCDAEGQMRGDQPGWHMLTGQRREEYEGEGWMQALHPDDAAEALAQWRHAVQRGENYVGEHRARRPGGPWREFMVRAVPLLTPEGLVREWVGVHIDVTDARQAARALDSAARRKDNFLAMLAHELRNPLAPIRTAAKALGHPKLTRQELDACQAVISRQVSHMAWLLNDLLEVSRISEGRLELRRRYVGLRGVVETAIETARPVLDDRAHALTVELPQHEIDVDADPLRLSQVLSNLLINAAKYTPRGGRVRLQARAEPAGLVIEVIDNGMGIPEERLPHVFEMFSRLSGQASTDTESGVGIGLALARGLVELHGGTLEAASAGPAMGSTFTVRLPAGVSDSAPAPLCDFGDLSNNPPRPGLMVLIADDNADAAESLAMLAGMEGHRVQVVSNGPDALAAARRNRPDVCILDIGMPGMDGHAVARHLREHLTGRPMLLLAVTGWGQAKDKDEALAAGFDRHFTKPIDPNNLLACMAEWQDLHPPAAALSPHGGH